MLFSLVNFARFAGINPEEALERTNRKFISRFQYLETAAAANGQQLADLTLAQMDVIELNEAFAAQALAVTRDLGLADDTTQVNPNGGAIAIGHPLGASGARLVTTALNQLEQTGGTYALCSMCIGVGQGIAMIIQRV